MRNVEEISLKEGVKKLEDIFLLSPSLEKSYATILEKELPSLQRISFSHDKKIFASFQNILNVISSIALKPFTLNKREEIIEASGKASAISDEAFRKTLKDSSLWKRYDHEMLPEEVYYFQYYDELLTYENIFIITLLEMISSELEKYRSFYVSLLKTSDESSSLTLEGDFLSNALEDTLKTEHKLLKIKNTSFYKSVSRSNKRIKNVIPTNILLRNQRYNAAYKFYKEMITYEDASSLKEDLAKYWYILLLKELRKEGYLLRDNKVQLMDKKKILLPSSLHFKKGKEMELSLSYLEKENAFLLEGKMSKVDGKILLCLESNEPFPYMEEKEGVIGNDFLSLWHYGYKTETENVLFSNDYLTEEELIHLFFSSHFIENQGNEEIYSKYCPVCKSDSLKEKDHMYLCEDCSSLYHLDNKGKIIFLNRRRNK